MKSDSSLGFHVDWRPADHTGDVVLTMWFADRASVRRFAARLDAPPVLRIRADDGSEVVSTPDAVLAWPLGSQLPAAEGVWTTPPAERGDRAIAIDMLEAFLAWTKSRRLINEADSRRISRSVQIELARAARDMPD